MLGFLRAVRDRWGDRDFLLELAAAINPQWADDQEYLDWFVWNHRQSSSPASAAEFWRMQIGTDITDILSSVRVPTLVMHRAHGRAAAEYVSARIPGATRIEVPGSVRSSPAAGTNPPTAWRSTMRHDGAGGTVTATTYVICASP